MLIEEGSFLRETMTIRNLRAGCWRETRLFGVTSLPSLNTRADRKLQVFFLTRETNTNSTHHRSSFLFQAVVSCELPKAQSRTEVVFGRDIASNKKTMLTDVMDVNMLRDEFAAALFIRNHKHLNALCVQVTIP
jgi:hypothetical protein